MLALACRDLLPEVCAKAGRCLIRMLALAYRDVEVPSGADGAAEPDRLEADSLERGLTLVGVVGLKDPLRPEVAGAIAQCQRAGITVRMLTGAPCSRQNP